MMNARREKRIASYKYALTQGLLITSRPIVTNDRQLNSHRYRISPYTVQSRVFVDPTINLLYLREERYEPCLSG